MTVSLQRVGRRDVVIAVVFSLLGVYLMYLNVIEPEARRPEADGDPLGIPVFLAVTVPLLWRRTEPIAAAAVTLGALLVHVLLFGFDGCGVVFPIVFLFAFTAGSLLERRESLIVLALVTGLTVIESVVFVRWFGILVAIVTVGVWATGRVARSRARLAQELETRTAELRDARDERARLEVATERARLSGELDELLQRRLGELAHLADNGARPHDAAAATATLMDIERESRRTLEDMRAIVGVLREDGAADAPLAPQPTLTQLEALLVRAKGSSARLVVEGSPRVLPPGVELSAYRVVEHLLAALDDAPGVEVRIRFGDDALELAVSGPAHRRAKAVIERARERVELQSGTLEASTRGGRTKAVASLPVAAGA